MTPLSDPPTEQRFIQTDVMWESFKTIQRGFANSPGVRLFYYLGELEIWATSPAHELIKSNLGYLLEDFMVKQGITFVATGSGSQEKTAIAAVQADESYCFGDKKAIPDLAIEIVITHGGPDKLKRYKALGVPEVWIWEADQIYIHQLTATHYQPVTQSQFVPGIPLEALAKCAAIASRPQAVKAFRQRP
jgi:Uma2 family endonuclease